MALKMIYEELLQTPLKTFRENIDSYHHLKERHLQAIWYEQKYLHPLKTIDGKKIEVINPGLWNIGKGPDFLKAHLRIDGEVIFGDIEIHLHEEGWKQHRHHEDPFYNNVILHLAYWGGEERETIKQNGDAVQKVILEKQVALSPQKLIEKLDIDIYPYKEFLGSGKCAQALFQKMTQEDIHSFFIAAAIWRMKSKYIALRNSNIDPVYLFAGGIAKVLGYRHNGQQFLELFEYLLQYRNLPEDDLLALTLGISGFFEPIFFSRWKKSEYYTDLHCLWGRWITEACHQANLRLDAVRPYNHPVRRLAFLVKMLHFGTIENMEKPFLKLWEERWRGCLEMQEYKQLFRDMIKLLPDYEDDHWNSHYIFETTIQEKEISFIGNETRQQIIINVFFPILFNKIDRRDNVDEIAAFIEFFKKLPQILTSKRKYLSHRFFGENAPKKIIWGAAVEQGAYQLHTDFCTHYESSCVGCPFVERMDKLLAHKFSL